MFSRTFPDSLWWHTAVEIRCIIHWWPQITEEKLIRDVFWLITINQLPKSSSEQKPPNKAPTQSAEESDSVEEPTGIIEPSSHFTDQKDSSIHHFGHIECIDTSNGSQFYSPDNFDHFEVPFTPVDAQNLFNSKPSRVQESTVNAFCKFGTPN